MDVKKVSVYVGYVALALFSFLLFLYLLFPYQVLKESLSTKINQTTGINLQIGKLEPNFPLGVELSDIKFINVGGKSFEFKKFQIKWKLLHLFIGRIGVGVGIKDSKNGELNFDTSISLFRLFSGELVPNGIGIHSQAFNFGGPTNFFLSRMAADPQTDPLLKPVLEKISIDGSLSSEVDLSLNSHDLNSSQGSVLFDLKGSAIRFDPSFSLPDQVFSLAKIEASLSSGRLNIKQSEIKSEGMNVTINGVLKQNLQIENSMLDMEVRLELLSSLKEQFAFVVDAVAKKQAEGVLSIKISGPIGKGPQILTE